MRIKESDALIVVDMQRDFVDGSLAVPGAKEIIEPIEAIVPEFKYVLLTADWHPWDHCSFKDNGGIWPRHCVRGDSGAEFVIPGLSVYSKGIIHKGTRQEFDSYSGFRDDGGQKTGLEFILYNRFVRRIFICGLALDYCVRATALDGKLLEFLDDVFVIEDLTRAVSEETADKARLDFWKAGVRRVEALDLHR